MKSNPAVWFPSSELYRFVEQRVRAIRDVQIRFSKEPSLNHGIITGLLQHLLRLHFVNPQIVARWVKDALGVINAPATAASFGAIFLHRLDVSSQTDRIRHLQKVDDAAVVANMRATLKKKSSVAQQSAVNASYLDDVEYPLGPKPNWAEFVSVFERLPRTLMNPGPGLDADVFHPSTAKLFVLFTRHMWQALKFQYDEGKGTPDPNTLLEAVDTWSCASMEKLFGSGVYFQPSKAGIMGTGTGGSAPTFLQRRIKLIPMENNSAAARYWQAPWKTLAEKGYLAEMVNIIKNQQPEVVERIGQELDTIFAALECLPPQLPPKGPWAAGQGDPPKLVVSTNTALYKLESVKITRDKMPIHGNQSNAQLAPLLAVSRREGDLQIARSQYRSSAKGTRKRKKKGKAREEETDEDEDMEERALPKTRKESGLSSRSRRERQVLPRPVSDSEDEDERREDEDEDEEIQEIPAPMTPVAVHATRARAARQREGAVFGVFSASKSRPPALSPPGSGSEYEEGEADDSPGSGSEYEDEREDDEDSYYEGVRDEQPSKRKRQTAPDEVVGKRRKLA